MSQWDLSVFKWCVGPHAAQSCKVSIREHKKHEKEAHADSLASGCLCVFMHGNVEVCWSAGVSGNYIQSASLKCFPKVEVPGSHFTPGAKVGALVTRLAFLSNIQHRYHFCGTCSECACLELNKHRAQLLSGTSVPLCKEISANLEKCSILKYTQPTAQLEYVHLGSHTHTNQMFAFQRKGIEAISAV